MTLEEYEEQEEKIPRPPDVKDEHGNWVCGECGARHLETCKIYIQFRKWYRKVLQASEEINNTPRPEWMCKGCDQPKEGPHRFSCSVGGARAEQLVLPAAQKPDGTFEVHLPGSSGQTKE